MSEGKGNKKYSGYVWFTICIESVVEVSFKC